MTLRDELETYARDTHAYQWKTRQGQTVPEATDLQLTNDAVILDAAILYADLAESTSLVKEYASFFAAEVYKNYLYCASRIIRARGGAITAYDGDRVMAVFIGDSNEISAAKCALQINCAVIEILRPAIKTRYPDVSYILKQKVGVDTSSVFIARTGIRGSNDLVWVGNAANNAAKMAALPTTFPSYISADIYDRLDDLTRSAGWPPKQVWIDLGTSTLGYRVYGSDWMLEI